MRISVHNTELEFESSTPGPRHMLPLRLDVHVHAHTKHLYLLIQKNFLK